MTMPTNSHDRLKLVAERREAMKLELWRAVKAASADGFSLAEIAAALRLSKTRVHQILQEEIVQETERSLADLPGLEGLPPSVRELVVSGRITPEVARQLNKLPDKQVVATLAAQAVEWNWTRSQAVTAARARGAELDPEDLVIRQPASTLDPKTHKRGYGRVIVVTSDGWI
jgi:hypothetical protein